MSFCPDPKHFIVNFEQNVVKDAEKNVCVFGGGGESGDVVNSAIYI